MQNKWKKGNVRDPLLLQVLPLLQERMASVDYVSDPLLEKEFVKAPGLLHKYGNRVLLIAHPACAIHCRYCFRREFDYQAHTQSRLQWQNAFEYIQAHHDVEEAILSGGDPLMHNDAMLLYFIGKFNDMKHLKRLRIHSRILSILPERINQPLTQIFAQSKLQKILVTHINHANEINDEVIASMQLFRQNDFALLNQSTLFKGVNDDVQVLKKTLRGVVFSRGCALLFTCAG